MMDEYTNELNRKEIQMWMTLKWYNIELNILNRETIVIFFDIQLKFVKNHVDLREY